MFTETPDILDGAQSQQQVKERMQSTDLRGDRDLDRDEETERDRFLNSTTPVSENSSLVMGFPDSCVAIYMGEFFIARDDSVRAFGRNHTWSK